MVWNEVCGQMMGGFGFGGVLSTLLLLGLVIVVYLWAWKLWNEVNKKR
ncbi:hypothetical protein HZA97_02955 [Candidatus Woesearchaeota archaeon]|nr:hypothetical protein [Candidatus Woesearchaeota archaeon]